MKIINQTNWDTKQLRKLFAKCRGEINSREGDRWQLKGQVISVVTHYSRGWIGGHAPVNGSRLTIKIPVEKFEPATHHIGILDFSQHLAETYIHEVGHNLGMSKHVKGKTMEHLYSDWIIGNISNEKFPVDKKVEKQVVKENVQEKRYVLALRNLLKAKTRAKRAVTFMKKWQSKVNYYEARLSPAFTSKIREKK